MANNPYSTSKQAADIAGITPETIGVSANNYVRKKELILTGKFNSDSLSSYEDNEYVLLKDISIGTVQVSLSINSDSSGRGLVQINNGVTDETVSEAVTIGDQVTVKCTLKNLGDVFDGWYSGSVKISSDQTYQFSANENTILTAKILYIDVDPESLDFENLGGNKTFQVSSNVDWSIS